MIQATNFIELNKHCSSAINNLSAELTHLSGVFINLPINEALKQKVLTASVKEKSAWYACLVNPNIDILLLPDYFETKQSRNILLKKETDQYQASVLQFAELKSLNSNTAIYENLFIQKDEERSEFDLFSKHLLVKEKCPETIKKHFNNWQLVSIGETEFENLIYQFCDWHSSNNYSFGTQRHFILWFNFQLWKVFGDAALLLNTEHFFYHHWNKESRSNIDSVKQFIQYLSEACNKLQTELKALYRNEIDYSSFEPLQKIANNFIYHTGFDFPVQKIMKPDDYSVQLNKLMLKKGFVKSSDITFKVQLEKVKLTLQNWYSTGLINIVFNDNNWFAYLIPKEPKKERLQSYCNLQYTLTEPEWDLVYSKPVINIQPKKEVIEVEIPKKSVRQKAFFG